MKKMIKPLIILVIITVLILGIVNSIARFRTFDYKPVVSYESNKSEIATISAASYKDDTSDLSVVSNILRYEQVILISSIILVIIFTFLFYNLSARRK